MCVQPSLCLQGQAVSSSSNMLGGNLDVIDSEDNVCLKDFPFLSVDCEGKNSIDLAKILKANGVMGLSPAISRAILDKINPRVVDQYFAFSFDAGIFTLGSSYDTTRFTHPKTEIQWFQTLDLQEWSVALEDFRVGGESISGSRYSNETAKALIDTGTSKILMPPKEFKLFKARVLANVGNACDFTNEDSIICMAGKVLNKLPKLEATLLRDPKDISTAEQYSIPYYSLLNKHQIILDIGVNRSIKKAVSPVNLN